MDKLPDNQEQLGAAQLIDPAKPLVVVADCPSEARSSANKEASDVPIQIGRPQHQDFLWKTHSYINDYIRFSDTKAGFAITLSGALLGLLYSAKIHELFLKIPFDAWSWLNWSSAASFVLLLLSVASGVWTIRPRLWTHQQRALIYWGGIAQYRDRETFCADFHQQSDSKLAQHLADHVFELSAICTSKYFWVSCSILTGVLGGTLAGLILVMK